MGVISEWTLCICISLVSAVVFSLLTPSGQISSFYKIIISIFIFSSFFIPFVDGYSSVNFEFDNIDELIVDDSEQVSENLVNNQIKNVLEDNGIYSSSISSDVYIDNNEYVVNSIQVAVLDEYDVDEVKQLLFDNLSINAKVIHIGD